jgi:hypothetical protein
MELLGDVSHAESHFFLFGDSVSVRARSVHGLHQTYHLLRKSFWTHPMVYLEVTRLKWKLNPFGDSANLDARWCTVCIERTIGSEIILDSPDGTPWWCIMWNLAYFHLDTMLVSMQDRCMVCARCTIGLEIVLDALDGTTRWRRSNGSSFRSFWR